jgi:hypothetical protein
MRRRLGQVVKLGLFTAVMVNIVREIDQLSGCKERREVCGE